VSAAPLNADSLVVISPELYLGRIISFITQIHLKQNFEERQIAPDGKVSSFSARIPSTCFRKICQVK
jgi:hypothetical protein